MYKLLKFTVSLILIISMVSGCKGVDAEISTEVDSSKNKDENITTTITTTVPSTEKQIVYNEELEAAVKDCLPENNGEWAVYCKNLSNDSYFSINNKKMVSASLIKLFIMGMVYDEINAGNLEDSEHIEYLMEKMITISHNDSSNELVEIAGNGDFKDGMRLVNEYAAKIMCPDTEQQRNMLDFRPKPIPEQNYTSVEDCGRILELIYLNKCVSKEYSEKMLNYLLEQERTGKIPAGLPHGVKVANKTGELSAVENDVAIVFSENCDYILCVISNDLNNTKNARSIINHISEVVYNYHNC